MGIAAESSAINGIFSSCPWGGRGLQLHWRAQGCVSPQKETRLEAASGGRELVEVEVEVEEADLAGWSRWVLVHIAEGQPANQAEAVGYQQLHPSAPQAETCADATTDCSFQCCFINKGMQTSKTPVSIAAAPHPGTAFTPNPGAPGLSQENVESQRRRRVRRFKAACCA
jgi:hypothetical protein